MPLRMPARSAGVDTVQQPLQLLDRQRRHRRLTRPSKTISLEPFEEEPESIVVPAERLDAVRPPVAKHVHRLRKRIKSQGLLNQRRQAVDRFTEVHCVAVQMHFQPFVEAEQQRAPSASITAFTSSPSRPPHSSATVTLLGNCAIKRADDATRGDGLADCRCAIDTGLDTSSAGTTTSSIATTGMNAGSASSLSLSPAAATVGPHPRSRIHLCHWFALTPALSTMPEIDIPGTPARLNQPALGFSIKDASANALNAGHFQR